MKKPERAMYPRKAIGETGMPMFGPTDIACGRLGREVVHLDDDGQVIEIERIPAEDSGAWVRLKREYAQDKPMRAFMAHFEAACAYFWSDAGQELWGKDPASQQQFLLDTYEFSPGVEKRLKKWLEDHPGVEPPPEDGLAVRARENMLNPGAPIVVPAGMAPLRRQAS